MGRLQRMRENIQLYNIRFDYLDNVCYTVILLTTESVLCKKESIL